MCTLFEHLEVLQKVFAGIDFCLAQLCLEVDSGGGSGDSDGAAGSNRVLSEIPRADGYFGLSDPSVRRLVEGMPHAEQCVAYRLSDEASLAKGLVALARRRLFAAEEKAELDRWLARYVEMLTQREKEKKERKKERSGHP